MHLGCAHPCRWDTVLQKWLLLLLLYTVQSCNCLTGTCVILGTKQGSFTRKTLLAPTVNPKPSCSFCPCCLGRRLTFFAEAGVLSRGLVQVRGIAGPGVFPWVSVNVQVQVRSHWRLHTQKAQPPRQPSYAHIYSRPLRATNIHTLYANNSNWKCPQPHEEALLTSLASVCKYTCCFKTCTKWIGKFWVLPSRTLYFHCSKRKEIHHSGQEIHHCCKFYQASSLFTLEEFFFSSPHHTHHQ